MTTNNNNSDTDIIIVIDKDKLPKELRDKFPQDLQDKLLKILQNDNMSNSSQELKKSSSLYEIQQGRVVGNIYKDGLYPEEKHSQENCLTILVSINKKY